MTPEQTKLVEDHVVLVQRMAGSMARDRHLSWQDAEDMVDDARMALVQLALSYDGSSGIPFEPYLRQNLARRILDGFRQRTGARYPGQAAVANAALVEDWNVMPPNTLAFIETGYGEIEMRDMVLRRMADLTDKERDAFLMYVDGLERSDVADILAVSVSRVSQLVIRAREKLFRDA